VTNLVGKKIGQYKVVEQITQGSLATIYKAYQPKLDRYVAIKVLFSHVAQDFVERFAQEARAIAQLDHPNIVPVYDFDRLDDTFYIVMKYVEGGNLKRMLTGHPMDLELAFRFISQVGAALGYAHQHGVIHRDVKPSNILVAQGDWALLSDFGIAKLLTDPAHLTHSGTGIGTPDYIAPEQARGLAIDQRADLYSLGATLYEMVTGHLLFESDGSLGVLVKHMTEQPRSPRSYNPELPVAVEQVILTVLQKDPDRRYRTAEEFMYALTAAIKQPAQHKQAEPSAMTHNLPAISASWSSSSRFPHESRQASSSELDAKPQRTDSFSILVVDDQAELLDNIRFALETAGYIVLTACDGLEALEILNVQPVDLILADIAMPRMNGYQLYERVRQNPHWLAIPFIFLTARTLDSDIRYGKELGVDDYLSKPIQPEDLLAAVHGKLKRARQLARRPAQTASSSTVMEDNIITLGQLRIDADQHRAWLDEEAVALSAREFGLLEYLARRPGKVISPQELIQVTHQFKTDHGEAGTLLRPLVRSLRRKLGYPVGETGCIENVRGVGYRLIAPGS